MVCKFHFLTLVTCDMLLWAPASVLAKIKVYQTAGIILVKVFSRCLNLLVHKLVNFRELLPCGLGLKPNKQNFPRYYFFILNGYNMTKSNPSHALLLQNANVRRSDIAKLLTHCFQVSILRVYDYTKSFYFYLIICECIKHRQNAYKMVSYFRVFFLIILINFQLKLVFSAWYIKIINSKHYITNVFHTE